MTKLYNVEPHMEVVAADGSHVGTVDHEEGPDRIKLTRDDGGHHYLSWDWVERVDQGRLVLKLKPDALQQAWTTDPGGLPH